MKTHTPKRINIIYAHIYIYISTDQPPPSGGRWWQVHEDSLRYKKALLTESTIQAPQRLQTDMEEVGECGSSLVNLNLKYCTCAPERSSETKSFTIDKLKNKVLSTGLGGNAHVEPTDAVPGTL